MLPIDTLLPDCVRARALLPMTTLGFARKALLETALLPMATEPGANTLLPRPPAPVPMLPPLALAPVPTATELAARDVAPKPAAKLPASAATALRPMAMASVPVAPRLSSLVPPVELTLKYLTLLLPAALATAWSWLTLTASVGAPPAATLVMRRSPPATPVPTLTTLVGVVPWIVAALAPGGT